LRVCMLPPGGDIPGGRDIEYATLKAARRLICPEVVDLRVYRELPREITNSGEAVLRAVIAELTPGEEWIGPVDQMADPRWWR